MSFFVSLARAESLAIETDPGLKKGRASHKRRKRKMRRPFFPSRRNSSGLRYHRGASGAYTD